MPSLNIFDRDAFGVITRTAAVNKLPYKPGRAGRLPIWEFKSITTTTVSVESKDGRLQLIHTTPRGGPAPYAEPSKGIERPFKVPHIRKLAHIIADQVQNVRSFGSDEVATVEGLIREREAELVNDLDVTKEYHLIGCLKGKILDADGIRVIVDIFQSFDETPEPEVHFNLAAATNGAVLETTKIISATMQDNLGAATFDHVHGFVSSGFMRKLMKNPEVRDSYKLWAQTAATGQMGDFLRNGWLRSMPFPYGDIVFEEYRGSVGGIPFIEEDKAIFFPIGAGPIFPVYHAPAPFEETVNTPGLPRYSKIARDPMWNEYADLLIESNPLPLCLQPKVLMTGTAAA